MMSCNPAIVATPDGQVGCLIGRLRMLGCVEFGARRILGTYPLNELSYWQPAKGPAYEKGQFM
jgi:hypothetical protein